MPNLNDAFDWAFRRVMAACEDRRLDPPECPMRACRPCDGHGFVASDPCIICDGTGEVPEED